MVAMRYVTKTVSRAAALLLCAASVFAFDRTAHADDDQDDDVTDSDSDADDAVSDTTVDGGYADTDPSALTAYRSELAPYGSWVEDSRYGTVWVPSSSAVGSDFAPYQSRGRWELADDGDWMWASDYDWGYVPFHYGRWVWVSGTGWAWIPGRAYANAWVSWRVGYDGYIGWAPMPPAYYWWGGGVVLFGSPPYASYSFCSTHDVFSHDVQSHIVRDKAEVQRAAGSTHPYTSPSRSYTPASPTIKEAHIPPGSAPKAHANPEPKSMKLARPAPGTSSKPAPSSGRSEHGGAPTTLPARRTAIAPPPGRGNVIAAHRLDSARTIGDSRASSGVGRTFSTDTRSLRSDMRVIPPEARTIRADPGAVDRRSMPSDRTKTFEGRSFDTRTLPNVDRSFERAPNVDRSPSPSFDRSPTRSPSFDRSPPRLPSSDRSPSRFSEPRPSSSPSFSPRSSPAPSAPSPPRRSAPAPSFHPSGGGGGHSGGGRHR